MTTLITGSVAMRIFNPKTGTHTTISDRAPRRVEADRRAEAQAREAPTDVADGLPDPEIAKGRTSGVSTNDRRG
ncbi:hypothetical protein [Methylobacterium iners]|uniref:hypothetical protein n=1 Tax=Methylobacterium iners TaxID=418707 RepID=UPI001EE2F234|nr:hypothetical protein [Methylobacterium iners]